MPFRMGRAIEVVCDGCGKVLCYEVYQPVYDTVKEAIEELPEEWTTDEVKVWCDECSPTVKVEAQV